MYDDLFENAEHITEETLDIALDSSDEEGEGQGADGNTDGDDDKKGPNIQKKKEKKSLRK